MWPRRSGGAGSRPPETRRTARPQLTLIGTIVGPRQSFGIFQDQAGNKALRLQNGEVYGGWVLLEVGARVVFQRNDTRVTIVLPTQAARPGEVISADAQTRR